MDNRSLNLNIKKYKELKLQMQKLEAQIEKTSKFIRGKLEERQLNEYMCDNGSVKITPYSMQKFDSKAFKERYPKLAEKYTRLVECTPKMTIR